MDLASQLRAMSRPAEASESRPLPAAVPGSRLLPATMHGSQSAARGLTGRFTLQSSRVRTVPTLSMARHAHSDVCRGMPAAVDDLLSSYVDDPLLQPSAWGASDASRYLARISWQALEQLQNCVVFRRDWYAQNPCMRQGDLPTPLRRSGGPANCVSSSSQTIDGGPRSVAVLPPSPTVSVHSHATDGRRQSRACAARTARTCRSRAERPSVGAPAAGISSPAAICHASGTIAPCIGRQITALYRRGLARDPQYPCCHGIVRASARASTCQMVCAGPCLRVARACGPTVSVPINGALTSEASRCGTHVHDWRPSARHGSPCVSLRCAMRY